MVSTGGTLAARYPHRTVSGVDGNVLIGSEFMDSLYRRTDLRAIAALARVASVHWFEERLNTIRHSKSYETDVIVVGYGGAGAAAAITAADLGARVLIVEKGTEGGGNTKLSSGSVRTFAALASAVEHIEFLCGGTTEPDVIEALVRESYGNEPWLTELGGEVLTDTLHAEPRSYPIYPPGATSLAQPGAAGVGPRIRVKGVATANGRDLWSLLASGVEQRRIPVLFNAAAKRLLRDPEGTIHGVLAQGAGGEIQINALKAVILTCGGYEGDHEMQLQFLGQRYESLGADGHNGDGLRMAADVGAAMWHMHAVAAGFGYRVAGFDCAILHTMPAPGFVYVDNRARRYVNETAMDAHAVASLVSELDLETMARPRVPSFVVFDEATRLAGPVASTDRGAIRDQYQWSPDNSAEIEKGWIKVGADLVALGESLGLDATTLEKTIKSYNESCANRSDPEFGRSATTLHPLEHGPYYGVSLWPSLFNTQGGPRRNAKAQVLDVWGHPIKGLYSAGELGSMWSENYPGASNLTEALAFGRIAGRNAAGESG